MAIGLIIIGDEILSGKRQDQHFAKVVALLAERGLQLAWAEVLGDDPARITATLARSMASDDIVFCCGGIGATPDDHTRQCAAAAWQRPLVLHQEGKRLIQQRIAELARDAGKPPELDSPENLHRLKMAEFPQGAALIPNPYNQVAGFALGSHYFVPGFPVMAWPMIAWVLDTHYRHLFHSAPQSAQSVLVFEAAESALTPLMEALEARRAGQGVQPAQRGRRRHAPPHRTGCQGRAGPNGGRLRADVRRIDAPGRALHAGVKRRRCHRRVIKSSRRFHLVHSAVVFLRKTNSDINFS